MPHSAILGGVFSRIGGFLSPYLWYIVIAVLGAFGTVAYLYANEVEGHRETAGKLETKKQQYQTLKDLYDKMVLAKEDAEKQVEDLKDKLAKVEDVFDSERSDGDEDFDDLMDRLAREKRINPFSGLSIDSYDRPVNAMSFVHVPENEVPPVSLAPPPEPEPVACPEPEPMTQERLNALCDTTPFSEPVIDYVDGRLRAIYNNRVQDGG